MRLFLFLFLLLLLLIHSLSRQGAFDTPTLDHNSLIWDILLIVMESSLLVVAMMCLLL